MHKHSLVLSPYTPNLHSCAHVQLGRKDLDWDALYRLPCAVHTRGLLRALAVACQPRAGLLLWLAPFGVMMTVRRAAGHRVSGHATRSVCHPSPGGRLHVVLQPPLLPQQGNEASTPTHRH